MCRCKRRSAGNDDATFFVGDFTVGLRVAEEPTNCFATESLLQEQLFEGHILEKEQHTSLSFHNRTLHKLTLNARVRAERAEREAVAAAGPACLVRAGRASLGGGGGGDDRSMLVRTHDNNTDTRKRLRVDADDQDYGYARRYSGGGGGGGGSVSTRTHDNDTDTRKRLRVDAADQDTGYGRRYSGGGGGGDHGDKGDGGSVSTKSAYSTRFKTQKCRDVTCDGKHCSHAHGKVRCKFYWSWTMSSPGCRAGRHCAFQHDSEHV